MKKITCIGGATGISTVLSGLKKYNYQLSAIFPVTDDGGSAGKLIKDYDFLPMGDARRLISALSKKDNIITKMLLYRFSKGELKGHALGAIMLTALIDIFGDIEQATLEINKILGIRHNILPVSKKRAILCAKLENDQIIEGENKIDEVIGFDGHLKIKNLYLKPKIKINLKAKNIIKNSDLIIIGPGDLHTSIIPNLLVSEMKKAIKESKAKVIYICNIMTKFGQTNNFEVSDFVQEIEKYLGKDIINFIIYNTKKPSSKILNYYQKRKEDFVKFDIKNFRKNYQYLGENLISKKIYKKVAGDILERSIIKHNPDKLSRLIISCLKNEK